MAEQVSKAAEGVSSFKQDCLELKTKCDKLAVLLRQAARANAYERPMRRIIDDTEQVLDKALALVMKCRANGIMKRVFTIIPAAAFRKTSLQLENSIGDVSWLLRVSASADERDDEYLGLPPIAANEPILCLIWEQIAILHTGSLEDRSDAAVSLVSLARDNDRYGKLIIEEGGVPPLLKLAKEGKMEGQENAARAIGLLGRDPESVEQIVNAGVSTAFEKILKEGKMRVQAVVAWAISELAAHHPKCQDHFAQNNVIRLLVSHLAFETVQEHSKYAITSKQSMSSIHSVVMASHNNPNPTPSPTGVKGSDDELSCQAPHPIGNQNANQMQNVVTNSINRSTMKPPTGQNPNQGKANNLNPKTNNPHQQHGVAGATLKGGRESEDPATKAEMKAMAARALWHLCVGNAPICHVITESRALLCFAVLLEKGPDEVQFNSAMALMEITGVAEQNSDLRRSAFKPTSPAARAVVEQLLRIIEKADSDLLIPCVKSIGNLARTFRATETRIIGPLVRLLDERDAEVSKEAAIALIKFASTENYLHVNHSKAVIQASGIKYLIQLVYFGEQMVQFPSLMLLCYVAMHVPDSEVLAEEKIRIVLEWASKQGSIMQDPEIATLVEEAKSRLELYQASSSRGHS